MSALTLIFPYECFKQMLEYEDLIYCSPELRIKGEKVYYAFPDCKEGCRKHSVLAFKVNYLSNFKFMGARYHE